MGERDEYISQIDLTETINGMNCVWDIYHFGNGPFKKNDTNCVYMVL